MGFKNFFCCRDHYTKWSKKNHRGILGKIIICAHCGKKKYKRPSDLQAAPNAKHRFCSNDCKRKFEKHNTKAHHSNCAHCGKQYRHYHNDSKYCSDRCAFKDNSVHVRCSVCKKRIRKPKWDYDRNESKAFYCSRTCLRKGRLHLAKPTQFELRIKAFLDQRFPEQFTHTGRGDLWIGNMNPDFIHVDRKFVIEAQGCWYHGCGKCHPNGGFQKIKDDSIIRSANYATFGFLVVYVWEHELKELNWEEKVASCIEQTILQPY